MSNDGGGDFVNQLARLWWLRLPLAARSLSETVTATLVDGLYLTVWPMAAAFLPPLALLTGLLIGWWHLGFTYVFSESMTVMIIAALFGIMSAHLGAMFLVGFAVGDFFLAHTIWLTPGPLDNLLYVRLPLLIEYSLLGLLVVNIPLVAKSLLARLPIPRALVQPALLFTAALIGHVVLTYTLVYFWTHIIPILIRPIFTWPGGAPTVEAMAPLQKSGATLIYIAVLASAARISLQGLTTFRPPFSARLEASEEALRSAPPVAPARPRVPPLVKTAAHALWTTLILAGMIEHWLDGLLLLAFIFFLQAARARLLPVPLGGWPAMVERVPMLLRMFIGVVLVYLVSTPVFRWQWGTTNSLRPVLILTALALFIFYLLNPGLDTARRQGEAT